MSRELADFLLELSIALNRHGMYPDGHPSLEPAAGRVLDRIGPMLAESGSLSLGVARDRLVIEGVATDPANPVLRELASKLHRHHLGAVMFRHGIRTEQLRDALRLIAIEPDRSGDPLGLGDPDRLTQWAHITLYPMHYDRLQMDEERESEDGPSQLWVALAQAAMVGEGAAGTDGGESGEKNPAEVARAITQRRGDAAYDQVIVGYLLQIAEELRSGGRRESAGLKRQMATLVQNLDGETLGRLLEMGGDRSQRRRFVLNSSQGMAADAVVRLVEAAGRAEEQTVSSSMLRVLQKLAKHAEGEEQRRADYAEGELRDQVERLVTHWTLKDPNPEAYRAALARMSEARTLYAVAPDHRYRPEPRRMIQMALEVDVVGDQVTEAADTLALKGDLRWLLATLETTGATHVPGVLWRRLATPDVIGLLLQTEPVDTESLDLLLPYASEETADTLLDVLSDSDSARVRSIVLERLPTFGRGIGERVSARLTDDRWYVRRNMLKVIGDLDDKPEDVAAEQFLRDADARVRLEALRIQLGDPATRERALGLALRDRDDRVALTGLRTALSGCPPAAVPLLAALALSDRKTDVRELSVRALGEARHAVAKDALLTLTRPKRRLFGTKLPSKTPVYLAALRALVAYDDTDEVHKILHQAGKSRDPEIAAAAAGTTLRDR